MFLSNTTEGSHAGISSAICHEDGRVDLYVWNLLVDGLYRRQIEYLCYNTSEEVRVCLYTVLLLCDK